MIPCVFRQCNKSKASTFCILFPHCSQYYYGRSTGNVNTATIPFHLQWNVAKFPNLCRCCHSNYDAATNLVFASPFLPPRVLQGCYSLLSLIRLLPFDGKFITTSSYRSFGIQAIFFNSALLHVLWIFDTHFQYLL